MIILDLDYCGCVQIPVIGNPLYALEDLQVSALLQSVKQMIEDLPEPADTGDVTKICETTVQPQLGPIDSANRHLGWGDLAILKDQDFIIPEENLKILKTIEPGSF